MIHTSYRLKGGEDAVFGLEQDLLRKNHIVNTLHFQNKNGFAGAIQFLISIWNVSSNSIIKKKIKSFSPDIIHLHNWHFAIGPLVIRGIHKLKIPLVLTLHNFRLICPSGTLFHNNKLYLGSLTKNFAWNAVQDKVYRNSYFQTFWLAFVVWLHKKIGTWQMVDTYVCLSEFMVDFFCNSALNVNKTKFVIKPNFSKKPKELKKLKRGSHFLFIGRLVEEKGIRCLLNAFKNSNETIKIAGDGPLKSLVEKYSLEFNNINYIGFLPKQKLSEELQQASALIFPSIWYEPFGLTITEAFSNRCAVIASNIGAPKSTVKNDVNGLHFRYNETEDLEKALKKWKSLSDVEKEIFRQNAFKTYQEQYSVKIQSDLIDSIYKNIIKE